MKVKTSITLSEELVAEIDKLSEHYGNRSAFVEQAVRAFLADGARRARDASDLAILNRRADALNAEARDVLGYQVDV